MIDAWVRDAQLYAAYVLPLGAEAHPWQEEQLVTSTTPGAVRLDAYLDATSPSWATVTRGGGFERVAIDYGYIKTDHSVVLPVRDITFSEAGAVKVGNFSNDIGRTTTGLIVERVSAPTVLPVKIYPTRDDTPQMLPALITWSGNIVDAKFTDNTLLDANYAVVAKNPVVQHTGGNTETRSTYTHNKNLGLGAGTCHSPN